jgi:hypothetical protein
LPILGVYYGRYIPSSAKNVDFEFYVNSGKKLSVNSKPDTTVIGPALTGLNQWDIQEGFYPQIFEIRGKSLFPPACLRVSPSGTLATHRMNSPAFSVVVGSSTPGSVCDRVSCLRALRYGNFRTVAMAGEWELEQSWKRLVQHVGRIFNYGRGCRRDHGQRRSEDLKSSEVGVSADSRMGQFRGFLVQTGECRLCATRSCVP